jgi:hypothetical protein
MKPRYEVVKLKYVNEGTYNPDVLLPNGIIVEIKGRFTGADRRKHLAVKKANPNADIRFVFQSDNFLTSAKAQRYSGWCARHGYTCAIGHIPGGWAKEPPVVVVTEGNYPDSLTDI